MLAMTAALERDHRDEVAGPEPLDLAPEPDHLAGELVSEHVAVLAAVGRVLGHM